MSGGSYKNLQGEITVKASCVIASTENGSSLFVLFVLGTNGSYHVAKQAKGAVGKEPLLISSVSWKKCMGSGPEAARTFVWLRVMWGWMMWEVVKLVGKQRGWKRHVEKCLH